MVKEITDRQKVVITMIEGNLNIEFKGKTRKDAIEFIRDNINESYQCTLDEDDYGNLYGTSPFDVGLM